MPKLSHAVINSSPLVALAAALDDLITLSRVVERLIVPGEVMEELKAGSGRDAAARLVETSACCVVRPVFAALPVALGGALGRGEAAVIHTALSEGIQTVVIDERKGRRWAELHGLRVTGSLGLLVVLQRQGLIASVEDAVARMRQKGIFLGEGVVREAAQAARKKG
jgi:predicted nucleic acid-binding protein